MSETIAGLYITVPEQVTGETSRTDLNYAVNWAVRKLIALQGRVSALELNLKSPSENATSEGIWCESQGSQEPPVSTESAQESSEGQEDGELKSAMTKAEFNYTKNVITQAAFDSQRNANRLAMATEFAVAFIARTQPGMATDEVVYALADRALTLADTIIDRVEDKGDVV